MKRFALLGCAAALALTQVPAMGAIFTATDGTASVNITSAPNGSNTDLTLVVTNLTDPNTNPYQAVNLLTGIKFVGVDITTFSIISETAAQRVTLSGSSPTTVSFDSGSPFDPGWDMVTSLGHALYFNGFGSGGLGIISQAVGDASYPHGGSSLTAGGHPTEIYKTATFVIEKTGAFDINDIDGVTFIFNTNGNTTVGSDGGVGGGVPEPATLGMLGLGALGLLKGRRNHKAK